MYNTRENNQDTWIDLTLIKYELDEDRVILENGSEYNISTEEWLDYVIIYSYDYDGTLIGFNYEDDDHNSADYFFTRNQLGDITHILNASGTIVVKYLYDSYGNILDDQSTEPYVLTGYSHIFDHNSYNYRGYRYDSEIGLYYLNSRYYNPEVGRFINSDGMLGFDGDILSTNMYAYCQNNPVLNIDPSGYLSVGRHWWNKVKTIAIIIDIMIIAIPALCALSKAIKAYKTGASLAKKAAKELVDQLAVRSKKVILETMEDFLIKAFKRFAPKIIAPILGLATAAIDIVLVIVGNSLGDIIANFLDKIDGRKDGYIFG